jgi:hypothetical protein
MPGSFTLSPSEGPPSPPPLTKTQKKAMKKKQKKAAKKTAEEKQQQQLDQQSQSVLTLFEATSTPVSALDLAAPTFELRSALPANSPTNTIASANTMSGASNPQQEVIAKCWLGGCHKSTSLNYSKTVACPACTVNSLVRYCSKEHLYLDIRCHFLNHCGQYSDLSLDRTTTQRLRARQPRPYIALNPTVNIATIERHRQAVYFAMEGDGSGDYFIFADVATLGTVKKYTPQLLESCRGMGQLVASIKFSDNDLDDNRKLMLRNLVCRCLMMGASNEQGARYCIDLAAMIRQELIHQDKWDDDMITYLCMCMKQEFAFQIPMAMCALAPAQEEVEIDT